MVVVAIAWMYVVVLMALAEGVSDQGSWLGASFTFFLYGLLPMGIALYLLGTPGRRTSRRDAEAREAMVATASRLAEPAVAGSAAGLGPDGGGHAAGDTVAPVRKEP